MDKEIKKIRLLTCRSLYENAFEFFICQRFPLLKYSREFTRRIIYIGSTCQFPWWCQRVLGVCTLLIMVCSSPKGPGALLLQLVNWAMNIISGVIRIKISVPHVWRLNCFALWIGNFKASANWCVDLFCKRDLLLVSVVSLEAGKYWVIYSSQRVRKRYERVELCVTSIDRKRSLSALLTSVDKIFSIYRRESKTGGITTMMQMMLLKGNGRLASKKS